LPVKQVPPPVVWRIFVTTDHKIKNLKAMGDEPMAFFFFKKGVSDGGSGREGFYF
jgi:hypothetical protein